MEGPPQARESGMPGGHPLQGNTRLTQESLLGLSRPEKPSGDAWIFTVKLCFLLVCVYLWTLGIGLETQGRRDERDLDKHLLSSLKQTSESRERTQVSRFIQISLLVPESLICTWQALLLSSLKQTSESRKRIQVSRFIQISFLVPESLICTWQALLCIVYRPNLVVAEIITPTTGLNLLVWPSWDCILSTIQVPLERGTSQHWPSTQKSLAAPGSMQKAGCCPLSQVPGLPELALMKGGGAACLHCSLQWSLLLSALPHPSLGPKECQGISLASQRSL